MFYWDMTFEEINVTIEAYNRKQKNELQKQATFDYKLADLIGSSVARIMESNAEYPDIFKVYPQFFDKEIKEEYERKVKEQEQKLIVEQIKSRILAHSNDYKK